MRRFFFCLALMVSCWLPAQEISVDTNDYNQAIAELSAKLSDLILAVQSIDGSLDGSVDYSEQLGKILRLMSGSSNPSSSVSGYLNLISGYVQGLNKSSVLTPPSANNVLIWAYNNFSSMIKRGFDVSVPYVSFVQDYDYYNGQSIPFFLWITNNVAYYYPEFLSQQQQQSQSLQDIYNHLLMNTSLTVDYSQVLADIQSQISMFDSNVSLGFSQVYQELSSINSKLSTQPDYTGVLADISTTLGRIDQYTALIEGILAHLQAVFDGGMMSVQVTAIPNVTVENPTDLSVVESRLYDIKELIERLPQSDHDYTEVLDSIDDSLALIHDCASFYYDWGQDYDIASAPSVVYTSDSGNLYYGLTTSPGNETLEKSGNAYTDVYNALVATIRQGEYRRVQLDFIATNVFAILSNLDATNSAESYSNAVNQSISDLDSNQAEIDGAVQSVVQGLNVSIPSLSSVQGDVVSFANVFRQSASDSLPATIFLFRLPTFSMSANGWQIDTENGPSLNVNPYEGGMDVIFTYIRYFFTVVWWSMGVLFLVFLCRFCFAFARAAVVLVFGSAVETTAYNEGGFLSKFSTWN